VLDARISDFLPFKDALLFRLPALTGIYFVIAERLAYTCAKPPSTNNSVPVM
jgi:hypothetical protein